MRPPRKGPTLRQTRPEISSGLMGVAATEKAATVRATRATTGFVFIAVLDGTRNGGLSNMDGRRTAGDGRGTTDEGRLARSRPYQHRSRRKFDHASTDSSTLGINSRSVLELSAVTEQFKAYIAGASSRAQLEFWIADQVLAATHTDTIAAMPASPERILAYRLGEAFCVLQSDDEEAAHFASRIIGCLDQVPDVDAVHDLL